MGKNDVTVAVFCAKQYDGWGWPPQDVVGFMAWFQKKIEMIPPEYRANAAINLESRRGYEDDHDVEITVSYWRPETDDERMARKATNERIKQDEYREKRRLYECLKSEFEA